MIDDAEVLVVRFSVTDRRLFFDTRSNEHAGPMIKVVPPAASAEERFKAIKMLRPRFRVPLRVVTFQWPRHARAMDDAGIRDHIARRIVAAGGSADDCDRAFAELVEEERKVEVEAVRGGPGFQTLWPPEPPADD